MNNRNEIPPNASKDYITWLVWLQTVATKSQTHLSAGDIINSNFPKN